MQYQIRYSEWPGHINHMSVWPGIVVDLVTYELFSQVLSVLVTLTIWGAQQGKVIALVTLIT